MKMFEVNLNEVPAGLDQKAFIKHPALKKINSWVTAAGVTGIINGLGMFSISGQVAEAYLQAGYEIDDIPPIYNFAGLLGLAIIVLAIMVLVTRKIKILIAELAVELVSVIYVLVLGGSLGIGIVWFVISIVAAYHYNKYWKEYSSMPAGRTSSAPYQGTFPQSDYQNPLPDSNLNTPSASDNVSSMYGASNDAPNPGMSGGFTDFTSDFSSASSYAGGSDPGYVSDGFTSTADSFYTEEPAFTPAAFYLAPVMVQGGAPLTEFQFWSGAYNKFRSGIRPQIGNIPAGYTKAAAASDEKMQVFKVHNNQTNEDWLPLFTTLDSFNDMFADLYPASIITFEEAQAMVGSCAGIVIDPGRENMMLPGGRI